MHVTDFTPIPALAGGALIGLSAALVLLWNGRIAGISGVLARSLLVVPGDTAWRVLFLVGLVAGAAASFALLPSTVAFASGAGTVQLVAAGLLVGFGTRLGGGCTSGHGVCGVGRGSVRSIAATVIFMAAGFATVYILRHALGAGG